MSKFSWKNKTAIYIGRFQPFHDGHKAMFLKALKKNGQVCILVMDSHGINKKNPFRFSVVKKKINEALHEYRSNYKIIKIPVVSEVVGVGVLVIGTPILLIFNYNLIEIMEILLPVSICTSLINYFYDH